MTIEVIEGGGAMPTHTAEGGIPWVNASGQEVNVVQSAVDRVGREIARWVQTTRGADRPSLFNRAAYRHPSSPYAQMETARSAVENDDVISGACDVTEALTFQGVKWEAEDATTADIFNQISRDLNLDEFVRMWHREDFTYSQAVVGVWWGARDYTPRTRTQTGKRSKARKRVACPIALTLLDPRKVVPLKPGMFGQDRLAWHVTDEEYATAIASYDDAFGDEVLREFTVGPIRITDKAEINELDAMGIDHRRLLLLNPASVFRITRTKASYDRFAAVRLKSTFQLLDLKLQLMEADRVSLVGAANFILLVRQGSKDEPATQEEIDNLKDNFKVVAKLPVVVGDHRLTIDIITPDQDHTLESSKYDTLDRRLIARALGAIGTGGSSERRETGISPARGVARQLEGRRHMMKRALEEQLARRIIDHPANDGIFENEPNLVFTPRNVQLDSDAEIARSILTLRSTRDLSRESTLEYFGFDQAVEALRREFEEEVYDDIFKTQVPFSSPDMGGDGDEGEGEASQVSGARGGRPAGGGESPQSPQGQSGRRTSRGTRSTSED
jgi:hypothetical protein